MRHQRWRDQRRGLRVLERPLGRGDAARWLRRHPKFWYRDASRDPSVGALDRDVLNEQNALDEFRSRP